MNNTSPGNRDRVLAKYNRGGPGTKHPDLTPLLSATNEALAKDDTPRSGGVASSYSTSFDDIAHEDAVGRYWLAREMQVPLGYESWQVFQAAINRAVVAINNVGDAAPDHVMGTHKLVEIGSGAQRKIIDYRLTRFGAYMVAMNGDPRKPEIAAAQTYFAVKTREAEVGKPRELSRLELIELARDSELGRIAEEQGRLAAEAQVKALEPKARTFDIFVGANGDYSVGEAAKILCRDHGIQIGEKRLFAYMERLRWVFRNGKGKPIPFQAQVDNGRLVAKARWYTDDDGEQQAAAPQVRVTPKGLDALRARLIEGAA